MPRATEKDRPMSRRLDAGRTVEDFRWIVREIVLEPQEDELAAKEAEVEDKKIENDIVVPADASDKDAAVSETPPALNVLSFDCSARSKPWHRTSASWCCCR